MHNHISELAYTCIYIYTYYYLFLWKCSGIWWILLIYIYIYIIIIYAQIYVTHVYILHIVYTTCIHISCVYYNTYTHIYIERSSGGILPLAYCLYRSCCPRCLEVPAWGMLAPSGAESAWASHTIASWSDNPHKRSIGTKHMKKM